MFTRSLHGMVRTSAVVSLLALAACSSAEKSGAGTAVNGSNAQGPGATAGGDGTAAARAKFFFPTGADVDNTAAPSLETDAQGNLHAVYPAYAGGRAYYAFCGNGCVDPSAVKVMRFATDATVANAMLALDAQGHPRVLLSSFNTVYYATCDADCGESASWTTSAILAHAGDREVSGEAFALDPQGRPRFMMHTYRAYLGIGQKTPETVYVQCDADCHDATSWKQSHVSNQIWQATTLRFDKKGRAHFATVATSAGDAGQASQDFAAYGRCDANCTDEKAWSGTGLAHSYRSEYDAVKITPYITLALSSRDEPRVLAMTGENGKKAITYYECEGDCGAANAKWRGSVLTDHAKIDVGLDLALDAKDHPRFVYTLDYMIVKGACDDADCTSENAHWSLEKVEGGGDMPADKIFPYPNCNVGAWFLHSPSLALTPDGKARVGYQARDISGGFNHPDTKTSDCRAGTDMTWSRVAILN